MRLEQAYAALRFDPTVPVWLLGVLAAVCLLELLPAALRRAGLLPMCIESSSASGVALLK